MIPEPKLLPLLRELCPKRYPGGRLAAAEPALDAVELSILAQRLAACGIVIAARGERTENRAIPGGEAVTIPDARLTTVRDTRC